jgi:hypothetical protein
MSTHEATPCPAEDRLIFACLKQHFDSDDAFAVAEKFASVPIDWDVLGRISTEHGIGALMYVNLGRCADAGIAVPASLLKQLRLALFQSVAEHKRREPQLRRALELAHRLGQDAMLLKGAALDAVVYAHPEYVLSLDIDILIRSRHEDLPEADAESLWDLNDSGPFEVSLGDHHDLDLDDLFPVDYPLLWRGARAIDVQGLSARVMAPADMVVFACMNCCRKRFFHPRNLYGLRTLLETFKPVDWHAVCQTAHNHRCETVVFAALECLRCWLGVAVPKDLRSRLGVGVLRSVLIRWLVGTMSFATLATRTHLLRDRTMASQLKERHKWQRSVLLPYACYTWRQVMRRLRWLMAGRPEVAG